MKKLLLICLLLTFKASLLIVAFKRVENQKIPPKICNWDCGYYVDIFYRGYGHSENQSGTEAFYPAFPLLTRVLSPVLPGQSFGWKATFLNLALFSLILYLLMSWAQSLGFKQLELLAIFVATDRFSLWAQVPYTEALFVFCVLCFLWIYRNTSRSVLMECVALAFGGLASGVRLVGVACVGALGLSQLKRFIKNPPLGFLYLFIGSWGVLGFFGYLEYALGSWDISLKAMAGWGRKFSLLGSVHSSYYLFKMGYWPTILIFLGSIWWIVLPPRKIKLNWVERICFFLLLFIPLSSTNTTSLTRYLSIVYLGHMAFIYAVSKILSRFPKPWHYTFWILFLACEVYFQEQLLEKFLRTEAFSWAG